MTSIAKLAVRNFGPFQAVSIEPGKVNLVRGANAQGKTTLSVNVLEALRYGRARGLQSKESVLLTSEGSEKGWEIEALVRRGDLAETVKRTGARCSHSTAQLDALFGDQRVLAALLHVHRFLDLPTDERRALLTDITAADTSDLVAQLMALGAPEDVVKAAAEGNLRGAERRATDARRAAAAEVEGARAALASPVGDTLVRMGDKEVPVSTVPQEKIDAALKAAQKGVQAWTAHALEADRHAKALAAGAAARERLAALGDPEWRDEDRQALADLVMVLNGLRSDAAAQVAQVKVLADERGRLDAIVAAGGPCPTCSQPMDKVRDVAAKRRLEVDASISAAQKAAAALGSKSAEVEKQIETLRAKERRAASLLSEISTCRERIRVAEASTAPAAPAKSLLDFQALEARVREIDRTRAAWVQATSDRALAQGRIDHLLERLAVLEKVEAAVAPGQAAGLSATVARINTFLATYGSFLFGHETNELKPAVQLDDDLGCTVDGRRYSLCSTSERDRASTLVAAALAQVSGVGLLVLDEAEHLDTLRFKELLRLAKALTDAGALDQVWIAQVPPAGPQATPPPWLKVWLVEGGAVRDAAAAEAPQAP